MTEIEAQKLVTVLSAAFASQLTRLSPDQMATTQGVYRRMLADLNYPEANAAIERLIATAKFLPTIAEIREAAMTVDRGEVRSGAEAWGDALKLIKASRGGRRLDVTDELVYRVVGSLGRAEMGQSENLIADRARFIDAYEQLAATSRRENIAGHLPAATRLRELRGNASPVGNLIGGVIERLASGGGQ